jgi:cyclic-di-GMP-binding protein
LKVTFPDAEISWIANTEWVPVLEENADLKTVIPFPRRAFSGPIGIFKFVRWCHRLSRKEPDLVLDFAFLFAIGLDMPSFDIVSEVDKQEVDNAINQARKELSTRFDFKDSKAVLELSSPTLIELSAENAAKLRSLLEIVIARLAKRNIDLRNIERKDPAISPLGHARQEIHIKQGLDGEKAKEIIKAIKALDTKVQSQIQDRQIRVTGKKKDDLQAVIQFLRNKDFGVGLAFRNFRD